MLYAGALLLAAGILVWLRDTLREQLQKPMVQASILAAITVATLSGGVALVARAKDRAEQRIIGRGFLLLGTLLLPLNPWFWLQSGLIEDRGNAWIVTLVTFAVSTAIAFGLGDRIFVVLSYAFAMATGWLLTYKLSGGAPAGAYALSIVGVSLVYVIGEWAVSRARPDDEKWAGLAEVMFWCGHIGLAITVIFSSAIAWFVPGELLAAYRHFAGTDHTPWISTAVPAFAAVGYFWSAWRQKQSVFTFLGAALTAWSVTEWLLHQHVRPGSWLVAAAVLALVFHSAGTDPSPARRVRTGARKQRAGFRVDRLRLRGHRLLRVCRFRPAGSGGHGGRRLAARRHVCGRRRPRAHRSRRASRPRRSSGSSSDGPRTSSAPRGP